VGSQEKRLKRSGIGFVLRVALIACALLVFNSAAFTTIYASLAAVGPGWLREPKITQLALFTGPVFLLCLEWWTFDRIFSR